MKRLTRKYLKECLHYDPESGVFTWLVRPASHFKSVRSCNSFNARHSGVIISSVNTSGYMTVRINNNLYRLHRLAWLYMKGVFPKVAIDHIKHFRADNRFKSLRSVSNSENGKNKSKHKNNKSGFTGVYWSKQKQKWFSSIRVEYKQIHLGFFDDKQEAISARKAANIKYGFHNNHGK